MRLTNLIGVRPLTLSNPDHLHQENNALFYGIFDRDATKHGHEILSTVFSFEGNGPVPSRRFFNFHVGPFDGFTPSGKEFPLSPC